MAHPKPEPRYKKGDRKGSLLVLSDAARKRKGHRETKWWVEVKCKCGVVEEMHQNQLDNRVDCSECYEERRGFRVNQKRKKVVEKLPFVPFERMRW